MTRWTTCCPRYKVILVQYVQFDRARLSQLQPGTVLIRYGIGVDNIDLDAAKELGIAVSNLPTYGLNAVSEYAAAAHPGQHAALQNSGYELSFPGLAAERSALRL